LDEIDHICGARGDMDGNSRRVLTELLIQMSNLNERDGVIVIGATNRPHEIDAAMIRRFEKRIEFPLPSLETRRDMLKIFLQGADLHENVTHDVLENVAQKTAGFSGGDLKYLCREAVMYPIREFAENFRQQCNFSFSGPSPSTPTLNSSNATVSTSEEKTKVNKDQSADDEVASDQIASDKVEQPNILHAKPKMKKEIESNAIITVENPNKKLTVKTSTSKKSPTKTKKNKKPRPVEAKDFERALSVTKSTATSIEMFHGQKNKECAQMNTSNSSNGKRRRSTETLNKTKKQRTK